MPTMSESHVEHSHVVSFAERHVNLRRDDVKAYRDQVNRLREGLADYINLHPDYNLVKMLHSGSVAKGTALKTINDMDVAVYVRPSDETMDNRRLLKWLEARLREAYPTLKPEQFVPQEHCVTVLFAGSGLDVDVVPVIYEDDPDDRGYLIVKGTSERVLTSIPLHIAFIRARKAAYPDHFAQLVRLVKWWVREQKAADDTFRFKSLMVELLCAHVAARGTDMSNYPLALQEFFAYLVKSGLKERIHFADYYDKGSLPKSSQGVIEIFDPVNPANNIAAKYDEQHRKQIVAVAHEALDALTEAHYATTQGRALAMWQKVFGSAFRVTEP
jgi:Second Messenger Oligonucleotide or Dinucleotide Synthetase domain